MRFQCPICKGIVSVEDTEIGKSVQCGHCNKPVTVPSSRTASGSVIGDFIILHELGRGGMGVVYLAHQISLDRPAAVKILSESYAKNSDFVVGFIKEARAAAKLNHPNIVQAYAVGDDDGIFYFAMEHIDGETMQHILKREKVISVEKAVDIVRQIAEALDYAWHEEKLVHRDIKPDNIMLTSAGRAKLADLGLAKVGNDTSTAEGDEVMGTPQYISPEQLTGDALDNRTDIYCLGATFYHFLTGRFPYEGASAVEIARQHLDGTLIPPNQVNPAIPESVSRVVEKMMAKDPAQRYQSAGQLAEDLALIKRGQNPAVATASGSIRVQSSNKNEAARKVIPPKLRMPGRAVSTGTDTMVDSKNSAQRSIPKLSLAGQKRPQPAGAPSLSVSPPGTASVLKPPVLPDQNLSSTVPPPTAGGCRTVKKSRKKDAGPGKSAIVIRALTGVFVVLILSAVGVYCYFRFVKKEDPTRLIEQAKVAIQQATATPEPSEFMKAADPVIKLIRNPENTDSAGNARQCYAFLKKRLVPADDIEKEMQREIIAYFVRQDEMQVETARMNATQRYEAEQERLRVATEETARQKMEAERRARVREAEQRLAEDERRQRAAEQARIQREENNFKNQMAYKERQMVLDLVRYAEKNDADGLRKVFEDNIAIKNTVKPEWARFTRPLMNHAATLKARMQGAWEWERIFTDGDPRLAGMQIELRNNLCRVDRIQNGVLYAKSFSGKEYSDSIRNLVNNRKFLIFAVNAAIKLQKKDTLPFYLFWVGAYRSASRAMQDASPRGRYLYSSFVNTYLREAWKDPALRSQLLKKFRGVPEYDRLNPPSRKVMPKKPAPKKPAPKKKK